MTNFLQTKKFSEKSEKLSPSPLFGSPVGIDINNLDAHKSKKFADVYKNAQIALGSNFHLQLKDTAYKCLAPKEKNAMVLELLEKTEKEIEEAINVIDSIGEKSELKKDFIQIGLKSVVNQLHALSQQYETLEKEKG
jgi:hypothetical protein